MAVGLASLCVRWLLCRSATRMRGEQGKRTTSRVWRGSRDFCGRLGSEPATEAHDTIAAVCGSSAVAAISTEAVLALSIHSTHLLFFHPRLAHESQHSRGNSYRYPRELSIGRDERNLKGVRAVRPTHLLGACHGTHATALRTPHMLTTKVGMSKSTFVHTLSCESKSPISRTRAFASLPAPLTPRIDRPRVRRLFAPVRVNREGHRETPQGQQGLHRSRHEPRHERGRFRAAFCHCLPPVRE